jgi:hypothetical protein
LLKFCVFLAGFRQRAFFIKTNICVISIYSIVKLELG